MFKLVVLSTLLAAAAAEPSLAPWGLGGIGLAGPLGLGAAWGAAPLVAGHGLIGAHGLGGIAVAGAPVLGAYNYRGPLSLAPGQPANILAADGRPLDTLSVNLDRAAHITAKAVSGAHILRKRSAPLLGLGHLAAPLAVSHTSRIDLPARLIAPGPVALAGPGHLGLGPVGPWGLHGGIGPLGVGHLGLAGGHLGLAGGHLW